MTGGLKQRALVIVATTVVLAAVSAQPSVAGGPTKPRNGTYSGAGAMTGDASYGVEIGFTLKGADVAFTARLFNLPGCTGGFFLTDTTLGPNRFESTYNGSDSEVNRITGRWVSNTKVRGKITLERPSAASCGDPGTYVYRYSARRYGRP
jgi:hypothetical protein